jgi:peptidoglycan/xylan/chitin deacetylase (PgdA/CDA1 family)
MSDAVTPGYSLRDRILPDKPRLSLPAGARLAVWTIVNVENWEPTSAMPRTVLPPPMGKPLQPDIPNWAWHEYGMRQGFWRFLDTLEKRGIRATFAVNGSAISVYEDACRAAYEADWEFMGHGFVQRPMHHVDDQREAIRRTIDAVTRLTGRPPRGWESPGLTETDETLDLLKQVGIEYVADWVLDDRPVRLQTTSGPIMSVPYTVEVNDVVMTAIQQHRSDEILRRGKDQFDQLYLESADEPRVMAISIHPYLTGVPHRIRYLQELYDYILSHEGALMCTGGQILDWCETAVSPKPPTAQ